MQPTRIRSAKPLPAADVPKLDRGTFATLGYRPEMIEGLQQNLTAMVSLCTSGFPHARILASTFENDGLTKEAEWLRREYRAILSKAENILNFIRPIADRRPVFPN